MIRVRRCLKVLGVCRAFPAATNPSYSASLRDPSTCIHVWRYPPRFSRNWLSADFRKNPFPGSYPVSSDEAVASAAFFSTSFTRRSVSACCADRSCRSRFISCCNCCSDCCCASKAPEDLRLKERTGVIARIKIAITKLDLQPAELFDNPVRTGKSRRSIKADAGIGEAAGAQRTPKKPSGPIKYRDEHGHQWTGRGKRPQWYLDALSSGK